MDACSAGFKSSLASCAMRKTSSKVKGMGV
jgi:hypothetical protein